MEMMEIQQKLDEFYAKEQIEAGYNFLIEHLDIAIKDKRDDLVLGLISELMGYYRVCGRFDEGEKMADQALKIINNLNLKEDVNAATTYLNIATLKRAAGKNDEALKYYQMTQEIYAKKLDCKDERVASLYNNISLLYLQIGDYQQAYRYEGEALSIIKELPDCKIIEATTYTNLAQICLALKQSDKAKSYLEKAITMFENYNQNDPHYAAALGAQAQGYYESKEYQKAVDTYQIVLSLIERLYGKSNDYNTIYQNIEMIKKEYLK